MDVGLDEIIKKKWKNGLPGRKNRSRPQRAGKKSNIISGGVVKKAAPTPLMDARTKIIARQRTSLRDAREKLNALHRQQDARVKLSSRGIGARLGASITSGSTPVPRRTINNSRQPRPAMDSYPYEQQLQQQQQGRVRRGDSRLYRTIDNDPMEVGWDPARVPQLEVRLTRPVSVAPPPSAAFRQRREDPWLKPLLRRDEGVKSRLEPIRQEEGYRIVVSNLQPTVTHEDIKELFEDIGPLIGSRVVRPGTAEVVYRDFKDAVAAVDTYHNRQLDGQPMKCLLVKPASSSSKGLVGTKGTVVPDLSTIHRALFMK